MSFDFSARGNSYAEGGAGAPTFPDPFTSLRAASQPAVPGASTEWVSFDDESGGGALGTSASPPIPMAAPATAASTQSTQLATAFTPSNFTLLAPSHGAASVANVPAGPVPTDSTNGAPLVSRRLTGHTLPKFPGRPQAPAPAPGTAAAPAAAPVPGGTSDLIGTIHRLPRPPTSTAATATRPAPATAYPQTDSAASPASESPGPGAAGASSNPFALGAVPHGATAASRSLDPFADLSLKPQLPRPPPMAASKLHPPPSGSAVGSGPASGLSTEWTIAPLAAATATAASAAPVGSSGSSAGELSRPRGLSALTDMQPPAGKSTAALPAFPPRVSGRPASPSPGSLSPSAPTTRLVAQSPAGTALTMAAPNSPPLAALSSPQGAPNTNVSAAWQQSGASGAITFDPFSAPSSTSMFEYSHAASTVISRSPTMPVSAAVAAGAPSSPPPYSVAVGMPSPQAATPAPFHAVPASSSTALPPPPQYVDALEMPQAAAHAVLEPPPSYEESFTLPSASDPRTSTDPLAELGRVSGPQAPDSAPAASWATFDEAAPFTTADAHGPPHAGGAPFLTHQLGMCSSPPLARRASPLTTVGSSAPHAFGMAQPGLAASQPALLPDQICVEVRLPPLKPKEAACPRYLAAGMGLAFAAPVGEGVAALQWSLQQGSSGAHGHGNGEGPEAGVGPQFVLPPGSAAPRRVEDWDSAPAAAVVAPQHITDLPLASCMLLDDVSGALWTGHKDGRVVRWSVGPGRAAVYEHQWRAHIRGKITSMCLTSWGELWTASSAGTIRSWQYPPPGSALRPPARMFECRRSRLALGAAARSAAQRAHSKARLLAVGPSGRVVWSAGRTVIVLWGAYDGEFLGTLTPGLPQDSRSNPAAGAYAGDTGAMALGSGQQHLEINPQTGLENALANRPFVARTLLDSGEEPESGDPDLGLQVIKGLAGAAKLAAKLGKKIRQKASDYAQSGTAEASGGNDNPAGGAPGHVAGSVRGKVVALVSGLQQCMYVAYKQGVLEKYTEFGKLIWTRDYGRQHLVFHSAALVGSLLWLGCSDGVIRTALASSGELVRSWKAHDFPVVALSHDAGGTGRGSGLVYSMSEIGSVRAWPAVAPAEPQLRAWRDGLLPSLRRHQLSVFAGTWNVNETRPSPASLRKWLEPAAGTEIVSIALQEVEMGTSSVARDAAITLLSKGMLERGNQNAQWWATELAAALACHGHSWVRVALRQMSGLVIVVFCRAELQQHVGEVATANVACGVMGVGGNKGAVAVSMSVFRRRIMFVSSHFAAHQERVDERNDNYVKIVRQLHFDNTSKAVQRQFKQQQQQQQQQQLQQVGLGLQVGDSATAPVAADFDTETEGEESIHRQGSAACHIEVDDDGHGPGMADAAMLVWAGDFNYRIKGTYADVVEAACTGDFARLFMLDQCRIEMEKGNIFRGLREPLLLGHPVFVPTYKYDKGEPYMVVPPTEPGGRVRLRLPFDTSEKQRVPAWTDRVFYRGSRPGSLDVAEEEVQVTMMRPSDYNCVLDVNDSDHKPVYAILQVQLPAYKQDQKRRHSLASAIAVHSAALSACTATTANLQPHPVQVASASVDIRPYGFAVVVLTHTCVGAFRVHVLAERDTDRALCPLPPWLEVSPSTLVLAPGDAAGWDGNDASVGRTRVILRALPSDGGRATESVLLRFTLQPLWGSETRAGVIEPFVQVVLRT